MATTTCNKEASGVVCVSPLDSRDRSKAAFTFVIAKALISEYLSNASQHTVGREAISLQSTASKSKLSSI